jgi:hypothetical protein
MKEMRNPFRLRRAENIDTESVFLTLFEPGVLEALHGGIPRTFQPLRSASGGGKTSLLRLLQPGVLRRLHLRRKEMAVSDLHEQLTRLGAFDEGGPCLLGVSLQCGRNYAVLEYLNIDEAARTRLFFSLLNSRILLATLRNALELMGYSYPEDVRRVQLDYSRAAAEALPDLPQGGGGASIHGWAREIEQRICTELDSFGPLEPSSLPGHAGLWSLGLVRPATLLVDGKPVAKRILLLMDDVHQLTPAQRTALLERASESRSEVGVWIAERFEALTTSELLASGSDDGRDHHQPVEIEKYWRKHFKGFEKHVMRLADRRVQASIDTELQTFAPSIEADLNGPEWEDKMNAAIKAIRARLETLVEQHPKFGAWVGARKNEDISKFDRAVSLRALEILIYRKLAHKQGDLFNDLKLEEDELDKEDDSSVRDAAELFLAREHNLPYYFGPARVARLASINIQQFLGLGAALFDEVIAAETLHGGGRPLSPLRQHSILKAEARRVWEDIPNKVRDGRDLRRLLESIGHFAHWYTYRPTAPNDRGVAGTAIRMSERSLLLNAKHLASRRDHGRLADLLASALAHNYLIADLDYKCKGDHWMVLNLNRLLCVQFDLPLGYGLYKERPLDELCRWIDKPYSSPRQESLV